MTQGQVSKLDHLITEEASLEVCLIFLNSILCLIGICPDDF